jgi:apolipoprotein N-acyltransferase
LKGRIFLNFILGAFLVLGFAPTNFWFLGILIPALLLMLWQNPEKIIHQGFAFGLGLFGVGGSWIYVSIATYGNTNILIASLITLLFISILALFPAVQAYSYQYFFKKQPYLNALIIFPSTWVAVELLRGMLFTGFPWLYLGYTQTFTWLSGSAKIFGVYGVSWLCAFLGASIVVLHKQNSKKIKLIVLVGAVSAIMLSAGLKIHRFTTALGAPVSVALVQGNIAQEEKWDPKNINKILLTYMQLTRPYFKTAVIVWPENAVTAFSQQVMPFLATLDQDAANSGSAIIFGIPIINMTDGAIYNGALAIGQGQGMYLKRHLVPFGEYIPLQNIFGALLQFLNIPMSNFSQGPEVQYPMHIHGIPVSIFICYESAYPFEVRDNLNSAAYIVTLTDDSWFGHSLAASQQQEIDAMRAIETERPILRATNNGITSIIDSNGHISARAPSFIATVLTGTIQPVVGATPWLR